MAFTNKLAVALTLSVGVITSYAHGQIRLIDKNAPNLTLELSALASDNLNPTLDEDLAAYGLGVNAFGNLVAEQEASYWGLDYRLGHQQFRADDDVFGFDDQQDFTTFDAALFARVYLGDAWAIDGEVSHLHTDQAFGTGVSRLRQNIFQADTLKSSQLSTTLIYGRETGTRYATLNLRAREDRFDDNNGYSTLFDLSQQVAEFNVVFRRSATGIAVKLDVTNDDFKSAQRIDSQMYRALVGIDWRATGKTKLQALVGKFWRDADGQANDSGLTWQVDYLGTPRQDIEINLSSVRTSQQAELETAIDSVIENHSLGVTYRYSNQWAYSVNFTDRQTEFRSETANIADIDEQSAGVGIDLTLKDHSSVALRYAMQAVESDDGIIDYRQNEVSIAWQYVF